MKAFLNLNHVFFFVVFYKQVSIQAQEYFSGFHFIFHFTGLVKSGVVVLLTFRTFI